MNFKCELHRVDPPLQNKKEAYNTIRCWLVRMLSVSVVFSLSCSAAQFHGVILVDHKHGEDSSNYGKTVTIPRTER